MTPLSDLSDTQLADRIAEADNLAAREVAARLNRPQPVSENELAMSEAYQRLLQKHEALERRMRRLTCHNDTSA